MQVVDLRSDTVTRPTAAMRRAMLDAELGDDVFGDDPTVIRLQNTVAALLGKEAALFVPSGTMANVISVRTHTEPGDEIIVERKAHIWAYEGGAYAAIAGVSVAPIAAERGLLDAAAVRAAIRPAGGRSHFPPTRLVCLENTSNSGGGSVYPLARIQAIAEVVRGHKLRFHLDGARLFNAVVQLGVPAARVSEPFDTISVCLSKGLGCPVGSLVVGSQALIERAHRFRKMLGGGMRQAGMLAAAGLYALEHHIDRLQDDHRRALELACALEELPGIAVDAAGIETNMVYADVGGTGWTAAAFAAALRERGTWVVETGPTVVRAVTHLDIDDDGLRRAIDAFRSVAEGIASGSIH